MHQNNLGNIKKNTISSNLITVKTPEFRVRDAVVWDVFSDNGFDFILIDDLASKHNPWYYQSILLDWQWKPIIRNGKAQLQLISIFVI